jgi:uncharacterized protein
MTSEQKWIKLTVDHIRNTLAADSSGHDWFHVERVWNNAIRIGEAEGANRLVVELAALLHDVADWKFHAGDETAGARVARSWLESLQVPEAIIAEVCEIILHLSFKGAAVEQHPLSLAGQVVQDADRLDAIGAIGIARAFAYGGHAGRAMYDPAVPPELHASFAAYKNNKGPTINHFHEKLLLLKDRLNTPTSRHIAAGRHAFMEEFLERFHAEWSGTDGASD